MAMELKSGHIEEKGIGTMDIFDLLDKLEEISVENKLDCPKIYIQIGDMQVPLRSVKYIPESYVNYEAIVLSSDENPKLIL